MTNENDPRDSLIRGFGMSYLMALGAYLLLVLILQFTEFQGGASALVALLLTGVVQFIYVIPTSVVYWRKGLKKSLIGYLIASLTIFLPTGTCVAMLSTLDLH